MVAAGSVAGVRAADGEGVPCHDVPTGPWRRMSWACCGMTTAALTPGEVRDALGGDLAYTTVMTVLTRLFEKGLVTRTQQGRAFALRAGPVAVGAGGADGCARSSPTPVTGPVP